MSDPLDELRRILNEMDIYTIMKRFLCELDKLQTDDVFIEVGRVYEETRLGAFNLPEVMKLIYADYLLPQELAILSDGGKLVKITDKGRETCDLIQGYEQRKWEERLAELEPEFKRLGLK